MPWGAKYGGRRKGTPNKVTGECKAFVQGLLSSPSYRASVQQRLEALTLPPQLEAMLWHYAYGKPKESHEHTGKDGGPIEYTKVVNELHPEAE